MNTPEQILRHELDKVKTQYKKALQLLRELDEEMGRGRRDMDILWDRIKEIIKEQE
jgi:DNA segregation ATPase FtsK/SpoIIIE-like protein